MRLQHNRVTSKDPVDRPETVPRESEKIYIYIFEHKINNIFYVSKCLGLLLDVLLEILLKRPFHKPLQTM